MQFGAGVGVSLLHHLCRKFVGAGLGINVESHR
jgi:hypothetical protein